MAALDAIGAEQNRRVQDGSRIQDQILSAFLEADGACVSGSALSERTGVTRTAVWKHIRQLEALGFQFAASPRRGYQLLRVADVPLEPLLQRRVRSGAELARRVRYLPEVGSTNVATADLAQAGAAHGLVVIAGVQTGGRGRRDHVWFSPAGGLWMSLLLRLPFPLSRASELTLMASVAVRRAILTVSGIDAAIKWPNDLLLNERKICGILAEVRADGEAVDYAVLGIGVNANIAAAAFPPSLADTATSLLAAGGTAVSHVDLAAAILDELAPLCAELASGGPAFRGVADEWRAASQTLGRRIRVRTPRGECEGVAAALDDAGVLHLQLDDGSRLPILTGDILFSA